MFKRIIIENWRHFSTVDIKLHPNMTVLTGANGSGKTTILNILAVHFGWHSKFVSSYNKDKKTGSMKYTNSIANVYNKIKELISKTSIQNSNLKENIIGEITYSTGDLAKIIVPNEVNATYNMKFDKQQGVDGIYINSHRPTFPYRSIKSIPTQIKSRNDIFEKYQSFMKTFVFDTYRDANTVSATELIKETIASLAIFGYGNNSVSPNNLARNLFEGYEKILKIVLPKKLGFEKILVEIPEVMLCTSTGNFPIDAVSGGISSIIEITWQLFMYKPQEESFVAIIDEPENHLHPELQKSFLQNLIIAFPKVQFIVATHNPFMISAVKDSNVYVLNYTNNNKVSSQMLDYINRAGTSNSILREVLGIDTTIPFWAEKKLDEIVAKYESLEFSNYSLRGLREEMTELGLDEYIPQTIADIAEVKEDD